MSQHDTQEVKVPRGEDDVLENVLRIWSNATGHTGIDPDVSYAQSGTDSLTAIEIIDGIEKAYGVHLAAREFLDTLTPRQIAARIARGAAGSVYDNASYVRCSSGSSKTIFLIHPAGGATFCYGVMNRHLSADYNICAIDLPEDYSRYTSLEELAQRYMEVVRRHQPRGPYWLGGYSFGGNVAYEIAGQLERTQLEVGPVVMFDSHPPEAYQDRDETEVDYEAVLSKILLEYLHGGSFLAQANALDIKEFCERWSHNIRLLKGHRPTATVNADLFMFAARKPVRQDILRELNMRTVEKEEWKRYFCGEMTLIPVEGDHYSIFTDLSHVRNLAKKFDALMRQLPAPPQSTLPTQSSRLSVAACNGAG